MPARIGQALVGQGAGPVGAVPHVDHPPLPLQAFPVVTAVPGGAAVVDVEDADPARRPELVAPVEGAGGERRRTSVRQHHDRGQLARRRRERRIGRRVVPGMDVALGALPGQLPGPRDEPRFRRPLGRAPDGHGGPRGPVEHPQFARPVRVAQRHHRLPPVAALDRRLDHVEREVAQRAGRLEHPDVGEAVDTPGTADAAGVEQAVRGALENPWCPAEVVGVVVERPYPEAVPAPEVPVARRVGQEYQDAVVAPPGVDHRLPVTAGNEHRGLRPRSGDHDAGRVPGHVRVVPFAPGDSPVP